MKTIIAIDADVLESTQGHFRSRMRAAIFFRESPTGDVISGQKAPLGRILRTKGTPKESRDLWSLPVAMVLVLLYYILYYY